MEIGEFPGVFRYFHVMVFVGRIERVNAERDKEGRDDMAAEELQREDSYLVELMIFDFYQTYSRLHRDFPGAYPQATAPFEGDIKALWEEFWAIEGESND